MRGCKMEHSKKFLGVMLCAFVQQPQRNKNLTPNMYIWKVVLARSSSFVRFCTILRILSRRVHACSKI